MSLDHWIKKKRLIWWLVFVGIIMSTLTASNGWAPTNNNKKAIEKKNDVTFFGLYLIYSTNLFDSEYGKLSFKQKLPF